jgi:hypothetical protein
MKWLSREGIHITQASPRPGSIVVENTPDPGKNSANGGNNEQAVQRFTFASR